MPYYKFAVWIERYPIFPEFLPNLNSNYLLTFSSHALGSAPEWPVSLKEPTPFMTAGAMDNWGYVAHRILMP